MMRLKRLASSIPLAVLFACWMIAMNERAAADEKTVALEARVFKSGDESLPYRLLKPAGYVATKKYPLVLFLHGAGERGADNQKQLVHGIADFTTDEAMRDRPCFLLAPQCPADKRWVEVDWSSASHKMPEKESDPLRLTMALLDSLEKEFSINAKRVYVTGLSMGGYGAWDAIQRYPKRFAAAIPICGGGDVDAAHKLVGVPIWAFHGAKDNAVKVSRSRDMIAAIKNSGGSPKYTEYPDAGHDSWSATYRDPKVHEWLFSQALSAE